LDSIIAMPVIRPVAPEDADALFVLAKSLGTGMTTFPANVDSIAEKIEGSLRGFSGANEGDPHYVMVLEEPASRRVLGISAVYSKIGGRYGFFSYQQEQQRQVSNDHAMATHYNFLTVTTKYSGLSEIGTLAVDPAARKGGAGKMLARARYMLIAAFPNLFASQIIAEMRGWQDSEGRSPFWDAACGRIIPLEFPEADRLSATEGMGWVSDLMPRQPIITALLPAEAQQAIGRPHDTSAIAMAMLEKEGFKFEGLVDIFDAGPQMIASQDEIATVAASVRGPLRVSNTSLQDADEYLVASLSLEHFRVIRSKATIRNGDIYLPAGADAALQCQPGEKIIASPW
jgi:arginine N-succinyltransferase